MNTDNRRLWDRRVKVAITLHHLAIGETPTIFVTDERRFGFTDKLG